MAVRQKLQQLFSVDDDGINKLFCGRPVTIKKQLDQASAEKWCAALLKAGAIVKMSPDGEPASASAESGNTGAGRPPQPLVAPIGADVLRPEERRKQAAVAPNTDHLSLDEPGADVLRPEERRIIEDLDLDLSHLSLK
jgi:hypothetical protein